MSTGTPTQRPGGSGRAPKGSQPHRASSPADEVKRLQDEVSQLRRTVASPVAHPFGHHTPATAPTASDTTTNHVDVLLATLVVKISDIANISDVLAEKIEAVGSSTTESTCRVVTAVQSAETHKLQAELAELRGMLTALQAALVALQPAVKDGQRSVTAQVEHLEKHVAERTTHVAKLVEDSYSRIISHSDKGFEAHSTHLDAKLERHTSALTKVVESSVSTSTDGNAEKVLRQIADAEARSEASLAQRLAALESQLNSNAAASRANVGERTEWLAREVQGAQAASFEATNARLDLLSKAVEGLQKGFTSALAELSEKQAKDISELRLAINGADESASQKFAALSGNLDQVRNSQVSAASVLTAAAEQALAAHNCASANGAKIDALLHPDGALTKILADAQAPVIKAFGDATESTQALLERLIDSAASGHSEAVAKAAGAHKEALDHHHTVLTDKVHSSVKSTVDDALKGHALAAERVSASQSAALSGNVDLRIAKLEAMLGSWFSEADRAHTAAAGSIASLHDGVWKGFDDAATHRRELAASAKGELLSGLQSSVNEAIAPVLASTRATQEAINADAPLRKAADASLVLLPGVAETVSLLAASTRDLRSAVAEVHGLSNTTHSKVASTENTVKELLSSHADSATAVRSLAGRHSGVSREDVETILRNVHSELQTTLNAAHAQTRAAVEGVHGTVTTLAAAHQDGVGEAASVALTITGLRNDMWKGFDDAATHRRELASSSKTELATLRADVETGIGGVAAATHAVQETVNAALVAPEAPVRRAAESTLSLLPATSEKVARVDGSSSALSGAVEETRRHAAAAASASEANSKLISASQADTVASVKTLVERVAGSSAGAVESAIRSAQADIKASVDASLSSLKSSVDGVQLSTSAVAAQCGQLATAQDAQKTLASVSTLRDGMWKGFDDAATHRRELASSSKTELVTLRADVDTAIGSVAAATHAVQETVNAALVAPEAPVRRAAESTLSLLPATSEKVARVDGSSSALSGAVEETRRHAAAAASASEANSKLISASQADTVASVKTLVERVAGSSAGAVESAIRSAQADIKASVDASLSSLKSSVDGVQLSTSAVAAQCGQLATAQDAQKTLASVSTLRDGMWKGFDDAAAHRREVALSAQRDREAKAVDASTLSGRSEAKLEAHLASLWSRLEATLETIQVESRSTRELSVSHSGITSDLLLVTRSGFAATARSEALEQDGAERAEQHRALCAAIEAVREAFSTHAATSSAGTRAELDRLGAGLQELADRVDALAQAYYGSNDTVLGRLSALQLDLAAVLRGEVSTAPPPPELSPLPAKASPPVWKTAEAADAAESGVPSTPAAGSTRRPSAAGSSSMMRLTLSTREEEALRRHMLRVGAAARFRPDPAAAVPKVAPAEAGGEGDPHPHHHQHHHHAAHQPTTPAAAASVAHSGAGGASVDEDVRSHLSFPVAGGGGEESGMQRYHEALRATGHKITERYVPSSGAALATSNSFLRTTTAAHQQQLSARRSQQQHLPHTHSYAVSVADSQLSSAGYNRHVHHSYGTLPVRSPATEAYVQHHSPPDAEITPGGGHSTARSRAGQLDSARRTLIADNHRGDTAQPLPPLADPHDHFEEDVHAFDDGHDATA